MLLRFLCLKTDTIGSFLHLHPNIASPGSASLGCGPSWGYHLCHMLRGPLSSSWQWIHIALSLVPALKPDDSLLASEAEAPSCPDGQTTFAKRGSLLAPKSHSGGGGGGSFPSCLSNTARTSEGRADPGILVVSQIQVAHTSGATGGI